MFFHHTATVNKISRENRFEIELRSFQTTHMLQNQMSLNVTAIQNTLYYIRGIQSTNTVH